MASISSEALKMVEFIKGCKTYFLATCENGKPKVRPFGTINVFEDKIYIQTGKKKDVAKQIASNPYVEISCFNGEKWLRLSGKLVEDERVEAKKNMLDNYPELRSMYNENDVNTVVYYFDEASAYYGMFTPPFKEIIKM